MFNSGTQKYRSIVAEVIKTKMSFSVKYQISTICQRPEQDDV